MRIVPEDAILIPAHAERVFEGKIFDVYQWPQELFDGSTATFEMLRRPDSLLAICVDGDRITLINEQQPGRPYYVRLPGGRREPGENWITGVQREVTEELGRTYKDWRLLEAHQPMHKMEWFVATFLARGRLADVPQRCEGGERMEVMELTYDEVKRLIEEGVHPMLSLSKPLFDQAATLEEFINLPEFKGKVID